MGPTRSRAWATPGSSSPQAERAAELGDAEPSTRGGAGHGPAGEDDAAARGIRPGPGPMAGRAEVAGAGEGQPAWWDGHVRRCADGHDQRWRGSSARRRRDRSRIVRLGVLVRGVVEAGHQSRDRQREPAQLTLLAGTRPRVGALMGTSHQPSRGSQRGLMPLTARLTGGGGRGAPCCLRRRGRLRRRLAPGPRPGGGGPRGPPYPAAQPSAGADQLATADP